MESLNIDSKKSVLPELVGAATIILSDSCTLIVYIILEHNTFQAIIFKSDHRTNGQTFAHPYHLWMFSFGVSLTVLHLFCSSLSNHCQGKGMFEAAQVHK